MKYTLNLRRNGFTVVVTAEYNEAHNGGLEEPSYPAHWFSDEFFILGFPELEYDEILNKLEISEKDFYNWIDDEFTLDSQNYFKHD
jgi:hypothetical protein